MSDTASPLFRRFAGYKQMMALYERRLSRWTVPYDARIVNTRHGVTHLLTVGDAQNQPLVILHGYGDHAPSVGVEYDLATLAESFFIIVPDVIGQAGKSAPERPNATGSGYGEWLLDVVRELGIQSPYIVASGGGAFVALKYLTLGQATIQKVCLIRPAGFIVMGSWGLMVNAIQRGLFMRQREIDTYYHEVLRDTEHPLPEGVIDDLIELHRIKQSSYRFENESSYRLSSIEMKQINAHLHLILGENDTSMNGRLLLSRAQKYVSDLSYQWLDEAHQEMLLTHQRSLTSIIEGFWDV